MGPQLLIIVVISEEVRDSCYLLLDAAQRTVGEVEELLAQPRGDRRLVTAARSAMLIAVRRLVVIILCWGQERSMLYKWKARGGIQWMKRKGWAVKPTQASSISASSLPLCRLFLGLYPPPCLRSLSAIVNLLQIPIAYFAGELKVI